MEYSIEQKIKDMKNNIDNLSSLSEQINDGITIYNNKLNATKKLYDSIMEELKNQKENVQANGIFIDYTTLSQIINTLFVAANAGVCDEQLPNKLLNIASKYKVVNKEPEPYYNKNYNKSNIDIEESNTNEKYKTAERKAQEYADEILNTVGMIFGVDPNSDIGKQLLEKIKKDNIKNYFKNIK